MTMTIRMGQNSTVMKEIDQEGEFREQVPRSIKNCQWISADGRGQSSVTSQSLLVLAMSVKRVLMKSVRLVLTRGVQLRGV